MNAAGPTKGHLERLSDGKHPKNMVFIQCVGSRCSDKRGKSYCSKICCMYTAKHAMLIRDKYPDVNVTVFYIDVRTPGKNFDEFYRRAVEDYGVNYIKGQVGKVMPQPNGQLLVQGVDLLDNKQILMEADMVVLATAIEPNADVRRIATMLTASIDTNNFLTEAHAKLRPVESPTAGVFLSGVCQGPKDIPETVAQAGAAAVKAIGLLAKDKLMTNPCTAKSDELLCNGCSQCANVCPYGAISYETKLINDHGIREDRRVAVVNSALCQGCGACTVTCPSGAMDLQGFANRQIHCGGGCNMSITANEEFKPKIVAFCCNWCSYAGADLAGSSRLVYPADVKIIRVPCSCRVNPMFILRAFEKGADGVILCGCHPGDCHYSTGNYYARRRMALLFSMLDYHRRGARTHPRGMGLRSRGRKVLPDHE